MPGRISVAVADQMEDEAFVVPDTLQFLRFLPSTITSVGCNDYENRVPTKKTKNEEKVVPVTIRHCLSDFTG